MSAARRAGPERFAGVFLVTALSSLLLACPDAVQEAKPVPSSGGDSSPGTEGARFEDATAAAGLRFRHVNGATGQKFILETLGSGVCVFDYDGDGLQDIYFVQSGRLPGFTPEGPLRSALYRNLGHGRFEDVTEKAGVGGPDRYGFGCVAGDVDGDGDLDLYVANYVAFDEANNLYCGENRPGYRTVCHPRNFDPQPDAFYRNRGDGTFEDVSKAAGIVDTTGKGLGVVFGDYDGDGDQDIYVANDDTPNFLWKNRGHGTFEEVAHYAGVALSEDGVPQAGMGTDMADYDNDGLLDIFVTNLSEETNELYHNDGGGLFSDRTFVSGLGAPSLIDLGFGTFFFDADNDGDQDVFVANGHIIDNIGLYSDTITFEQRAAMYRNVGGGRFERLSYPATAPLGRPYVGRGAVPFDYDDDGDEDIVLTQNDRPALLLRNTGSPGRHWVTITLAGAPPNRDAVGAIVTLQAGGTRQVRYARTEISYLSQGDRRLHFGLGTAAAIDRVSVRWPGRGGFREVFSAVPVDRFVTLEQGKGTRVPGE